MASAQGGDALAESHTRQSKRTPVSLKIKFKSATLDQFIERYSVDVSHGGIFIRTKDPLPVGTTMRFEFQLKDASPLITGEGTVVWTRENDPNRTGVAPGMGVRFDKLTDGSQQVLDKILAQKGGKAEPEVEMEGRFMDVPTRVAPRPLVDDLAKESKSRPSWLGPAMASFDERSDATPLPSPVPFHSDADEFSDETFEEATKVRSLDELVAATATEDIEAMESAQIRTGAFEAISALEAAAALEPGVSGFDIELGAAGVAGDTIEDSGEEPGFDPDASTLDRDIGPDVEGGEEPMQGASAAELEAGSDAARAAALVDELAARRKAKQREHDGQTGALAEGPETTTNAEPEAGHDSGKAALASATQARASAAFPVEKDDEATAIVGSHSSPAGERATHAAAPSQTSNTGIALAVLAVLLLALGVGGYFLLVRGKDKAQEQPTTQETGSAGGRETPTTPVNDDPAGKATPAIAATVDAGAADAATAQATNAGEAEIAIEPEIEIEPEVKVELVKIEVRSTPRGATAELVGTDQRGPTPMTFEVDTSKTHTVRLSMPGYAAQEITLDPRQGRPPAVTLALAPMIIRVNSEPTGAFVYVDGRRVTGETPTEFRLPDDWRRRKKFKVSLRKEGYDKLDVTVTADQFQTEGDAGVVVVSETMTKAAPKVPSVRPGGGTQRPGGTGQKDPTQTNGTGGSTQGSTTSGSDSSGTNTTTTPDSGSAPGGGDAVKSGDTSGTGTTTTPALQPTSGQTEPAPGGAK